MSPEDLKHKLESGRPPLLIDVRDQDKFDAAHLPGARNIPLAELPNHFHELRDSGPVLVY